MADSTSDLRALAWSSVLLGVVLAAAQVAWHLIGPSGLGGPAAADTLHVALLALAVLGWICVVVCGVAALSRGVVPGSLAATALVTGVVSLVGQLALLGVAAFDRLGPDAFDDVLIQTWPPVVLCLFAGDWFRRSRARSRPEVLRVAPRGKG